VSGRSDFKANLEISAYDRVITLSTCAYRFEELKNLYDSQKDTESLVGNQLISYIEDGVKINTKNVTDVAARIREKMNQNQ